MIDADGVESDRARSGCWFVTQRNTTLFLDDPCLRDAVGFPTPRRPLPLYRFVRPPQCVMLARHSVYSVLYSAARGYLPFILCGVLRHACTLSVLSIGAAGVASMFSLCSGCAIGAVGVVSKYDGRAQSK